MSDDSSSSSSSSSSESVASSDDGALRRRPGRRPNPEAVALQKDLKPWFSKSRAVVQYYRQHSDAVADLERAAKQDTLHCSAYVAETATRWSSSMSSAMSVIKNNAAHAVFTHRRRKTDIPEAFSQQEIQMGVEICTILYPIHIGTRLLEANGEKACCSVYLPTWHAVSTALAGEHLRTPADFRERLGCRRSFPL